MKQKTNTKKADKRPVDKNAAKAKKLFATHTCNVFYFTADGEAFARIAHAQSHAANLNDSEIQTITREDK